MDDLLYGIDDNPAISLLKLRMKAKVWKRKHGAGQTKAIAEAPWLIGLDFGLALLLLPAPALPSSWNMTYPLNGPAWSLFQEYLANILYGLSGHRFSVTILAWLCALSASLLLFAAVSTGNLTGGWSWDNAWVGVVRASSGFFLGLLMFRLRWSVALPFAFPTLSAVLLCVFMAPDLGTTSAFFDWAMAVFVFPCIVLLASSPSARSNACLDAIANVSGRTSYLLYILHYPFLFLFAHWIWGEKPEQQLVWTVACGLMLGIPLLAWLILI